MKLIEMIAVFSCEGKSRPYRFKMPVTEHAKKLIVWISARKKSWLETG